MVRFERRGHVGIATLNRPAAKNAINRELEEELFQALERIDSDPGLRVGIIAAEGDIFCAGADLKEVKEKGNPRGVGTPARESIVSRAHAKPLIAAVDGPAYGGGMELILACDIVVASSKAKFALSEVRWGLLPSGGGMFRLPRVLPHNIALQMLLTGGSMTAGRAHALGWVNELAEPGEALNEALRIADVIAANGPLAVQRTLQLVEASAHLSEPDLWTLSRKLVAENFRSGDALEGPRAFVEKRPPKWKGC